MLLSDRRLPAMCGPPVLPTYPRSQWTRLEVPHTLEKRAHDYNVKKSPPDAAGPGFIIGGDPAARVSHLEHSVRFLQEQHRLMLSGLHAEIEALRERNRDLQFQLIFKQESSPKSTSPASEESSENSEEAKLKRDVARLEKEASSARSEARAAEARALQLQRLVDAQTEKLRELEIKPKCSSCDGTVGPPAPGATDGSDEEGTAESRAALRARLADAERLVRRLRAEAERRRREVLAAAGGSAGGAVTNLLFDGAAARHAHLQCMKNSLHASLRTAAPGLDGFGYQNNYHFPPVHAPDFWREPIRDEFAAGARGRGCRPLTLPDVTQTRNRSTVYANNHTRPRATGYENKNKRQQSTNGEVPNGKSPEEPQESPRFLPNIQAPLTTIATYPELKIVVTKIIPHGNVNGQAVNGQATDGRARRRTHRKHASEHT